MVEEESGDGADYDDTEAERSGTAWRLLESRLEVWYKLAMDEEP